MIWILVLIFAYLAVCGAASGYVLYVFNEGFELRDLDGEDMFSSIMVGLFWPITLPSILFFRWFSSTKGGDSNG